MVAAINYSPAEEEKFRRAARRWLELKEAIDAANFVGRRKPLSKMELIALRTSEQREFIARFKKNHLDNFIPYGMSESESVKLIMDEQVKLDDEKHEARMLQQRIERGISPLSMEAL